MAKLLAANNAVATVAQGITSGQTTILLTSGGGALFPSPVNGQYFRATIVKNADPTIFEIVLCTARTTDSLTIVRGQEGTSALPWNAGDFFNNFPTAGTIADLTQFDDLQAQKGNYAIDTGPANAYAVTLTPALTAHVPGAPIRFLAGHTNTGASTFNDGAGLGPLRIAANPSADLWPGAIVAQGVYEVIYANGTFFLTGCPSNILDKTTASSTYVPQSLLAGPGVIAGNKIAEYDGNGYLFALYHNQSSPNSENPSISQVMVTNGSDGFMRKASFASFISQMNLGSTYAQLSQFPGSFGASGWQKLPNGFIRQWGSALVGASGEQVWGPYTFPIAFPNAVLNISLTTITFETGGGGTQWDEIAEISSSFYPNTSQFWVYSQFVGGATNFGGFYYEAIGY